MGREKAVKGRVGGSMGEEGEVGGNREGPGKEGCLSFRCCVVTIEEVRIVFSSVVEREAII